MKSLKYFPEPIREALQIYAEYFFYEDSKGAFPEQYQIALKKWKKSHKKLYKYLYSRK